RRRRARRPRLADLARPLGKFPRRQLRRCPPMSPPAPRWRPSAFIVASALAHVAALGAVVARPRLWPVALGAVVADHLALTAAGLWRRSTLLGRTLTRLPAAAAPGRVALTIDDGPDPEVTPQVLRLLEAHRATVTFFCIGEQVARHAGLARDI